MSEQTQQAETSDTLTIRDRVIRREDALEYLREIYVLSGRPPLPMITEHNMLRYLEALTDDELDELVVDVQPTNFDPLWDPPDMARLGWGVESGESGSWQTWVSRMRGVKVGVNADGFICQINFDRQGVAFQCCLRTHADAVTVLRAIGEPLPDTERGAVELAREYRDQVYRLGVEQAVVHLRDTGDLMDRARTIQQENERLKDDLARLREAAERVDSAGAEYDRALRENGAYTLRYEELQNAIANLRAVRQLVAAADAPPLSPVPGDDGTHVEGEEPR